MHIRCYSFPLNHANLFMYLFSHVSQNTGLLNESASFNVACKHLRVFPHVDWIMAVTSSLTVRNPPFIILFWRFVIPDQISLRFSCCPPLSLWVVLMQSRGLVISPAGFWMNKKKIPPPQGWNNAAGADSGCCSTGAIVAHSCKQLIYCGWTLHPGVHREA